MGERDISSPKSKTTWGYITSKENASRFGLFQRGTGKKKRIACTRREGWKKTLTQD